MDFLDFLKLQFLVKKSFFFIQNVQKKNTDEQKNRFLDKKHRLTLFENVDILSPLKLQFSGLKIITFYPEYQKTIFCDLISPKNTNKEKFDFWTKTMDYPPWSIFFDFLKLKFSALKFILFYPENQEMIFSNIILQKH